MDGGVDQMLLLLLWVAKIRDLIISSERLLANMFVGLVACGG